MVEAACFDRPALVDLTGVAAETGSSASAKPRISDFQTFFSRPHFLGRLNLHHCSAIGSIWLNKKSSNVKTPESTRLRRDGFLPLCLFA